MSSSTHPLATPAVVSGVLLSGPGPGPPTPVLNQRRLRGRLPSLCLTALSPRLHSTHRSPKAFGEHSLTPCPASATNSVSLTPTRVCLSCSSPEAQHVARLQQTAGDRHQEPRSSSIPCISCVLCVQLRADHSANITSHHVTLRPPLPASTTVPLYKGTDWNQGDCTLGRSRLVGPGGGPRGPAQARPLPPAGLPREWLGGTS